jgi:hypothetical protein
MRRGHCLKNSHKISEKELSRTLINIKHSQANPRNSKYIRDMLAEAFQRNLMTLTAFLSEAENKDLNPLYRAATYQLLAKYAGGERFPGQGFLAFNLGVTKLSCWKKAQLLYKQGGDDDAASCIEERINYLVHPEYADRNKSQFRSNMHEVSLACNPSSMFYRGSELIGYRHDPYGVSVIPSEDTSSVGLDRN